MVTPQRRAHLKKYTVTDSESSRIAAIRERVSVDRAWAVRGLLAIYAHQTREEQNIGATTMHNGVGFNGVDGTILSSFAEQVQKGRVLSDKQMRLLYAKMPKYSKQLDGIAQQCRTHSCA